MKYGGDSCDALRPPARVSPLEPALRGVSPSSLSLFGCGAADPWDLPPGAAD